MTGFDKTVSRRTIGKYRFAISGAFRSEAGRRLVVELSGDDHADLLRIREERRREWVELDIPSLYLKGLKALHAARTAQRRAANKRQR